MYLVSAAAFEEKMNSEPKEQQNLLAHAEQIWGPQFREDGTHAWWCTSEVPGIDQAPPDVRLDKCSAVTDGETYLLSSSVAGYREAALDEAGKLTVSKPKQYDFMKSKSRRIPLSWLT